MDGYRQAAAVDMVGGVKKLLEKLCVKDTDKEIKARIIIRYQRKQRRFLLAHWSKVKLIGRSQRR